ncbi:MAG TPA: formate dehydrogenase accessory protein FdhE [Candidatus Acidoferrum sp.]|nr:formate dehydrogenase accessory protein FdhE [Candidatus Acidoferrum sp.]
MAAGLVRTDVWSKRRLRAADLAQRWPFAAEVLAFYTVLLDVQEQAFLAALDDTPKADAIAAYAAERVLPRVIGVSVASGPPALVAAVVEQFHEVDLTGMFTAWLRGDELSPVERYLARAAVGPLLEALGAAAREACGEPRDERHCPACGGLPQVGYFASSPEDLVTAHRYLVCARCAATWAYPRLTCAACGESDTGKLEVYAEIGTTQAELSGTIVKPGAAPSAAAVDARFPHLRIDGCRTCARYLLTVDLDRDPRAVPLVDEIAAIPLDLYAKERGLTKLVPNLMGL